MTNKTECALNRMESLSLNHWTFSLKLQILWLKLNFKNVDLICLLWNRAFDLKYFYLIYVLAFILPSRCLLIQRN